MTYQLGFVSMKPYDIFKRKLLECIKKKQAIETKKRKKAQDDDL